MLSHALIINAVVLFVILESDLGRHRKVTRFRLVRPLVTSLLVVPFFLGGLATSGAGLGLELGLTAAGIVVGLIASTQMTVFADPATGQPRSRAGIGYAAVWIVVVGARVAFSYGSAHWFSSSLDRWLVEHHVSSGALTDALIFMALAMIVVRVAVLAARARRLRGRPSVAASGAGARPVDRGLAPVLTAAGPSRTRSTEEVARHAVQQGAQVLSVLVAERSGRRAARRGRRGR